MGDGLGVQREVNIGTTERRGAKDAGSERGMTAENVDLRMPETTRDDGGGSDVETSVGGP